MLGLIKIWYVCTGRHTYIHWKASVHSASGRGHPTWTRADKTSGCQSSGNCSRLHAKIFSYNPGISWTGRMLVLRMRVLLLSSSTILWSSGLHLIPHCKIATLWTSSSYAVIHLNVLITVLTGSKGAVERAQCQACCRTCQASSHCSRIPFPHTKTRQARRPALRECVALFFVIWLPWQTPSVLGIESNKYRLQSRHLEGTSQTGSLRQFVLLWPVWSII